MSQRNIDKYLDFAKIFDDDLDMMAHALIQLGGVHVKPSRLKDIMLAYNATEYIAIMEELSSMEVIDIFKWKCSYFDMVLKEKKRLVTLEDKKLAKLRDNL